MRERLINTIGDHRGIIMRERMRDIYISMYNIMHTLLGNLKVDSSLINDHGVRNGRDRGKERGRDRGRLGKAVSS